MLMLIDFDQDKNNFNGFDKKKSSKSKFFYYIRTYIPIRVS